MGEKEHKVAQWKKGKPNYERRAALDTQARSTHAKPAASHPCTGMSILAPRVGTHGQHTALGLRVHCQGDPGMALKNRLHANPPFRTVNRTRCYEFSYSITTR